MAKELKDKKLSPRVAWQETLHGETGGWWFTFVLEEFPWDVVVWDQFKGCQFASLPFPLYNVLTSLSWLLVCAAGSQIPEQFVSKPKAPTDTCRKDTYYIQPKADSVDNLARSKILVNFPIPLHMLLNIQYQCSTKLTKEQHRHISKMFRKTDFRLTEFLRERQHVFCLSTYLLFLSPLLLVSYSNKAGEVSSERTEDFIQIFLQSKFVNLSLWMHPADCFYFFNVDIFLSSLSSLQQLAVLLPDATKVYWALKAGQP